MLKSGINIKINVLFFLSVPLMLICQGGCVKKIPKTEYLKITIDWNSIEDDPNYPIAACAFTRLYDVKLILGPVDKVIDGEVYVGMEGYENDDIEKPGECIFRFLTRRKNEEIVSVILESTVKTNITLKNFSGTIYGIDNNKDSDYIYRFEPGKYEFEMGK